MIKTSPLFSASAAGLKKALGVSASFSALVMLTACQPPADGASSAGQTQRGQAQAGQTDNAINLMNFGGINSGEAEAVIEATNANVRLIRNNEGNALAVTFKGKNHYFSGVTLRPNETWNLDVENSVLAFDIANPGAQPVQILLDIKDAGGAVHTRTAVVPKGGFKTYYVELEGGNVEIDTGLRNPPPVYDVDGTQFVWMWGQKKLDIAQIESLSFTSIGLKYDRDFVLDNIRVLKGLEAQPDYIVNIVDKYGQNAKANFPGKVRSDEMLAKLTREEAARLSAGKLEDRSPFGGWAKGPKLKATGFYRTEKLKDRWALVDPEGYLFFSTGIANVRMSNTSTMTGYDFDPELLKARSSDDLTPEDSIGLNRVPDRAINSRAISSDMRANMFEWLPAYDAALGDHFGYRREVHSGPVKKGETFSFYRANLERKYGETDIESYMEDWRKTTVDRMLNWGFTSFGNWVDPSFYGNNRMPYFANGWIIGDYKTVSSGDDYWSPLPDPFDPLFKTRTAATVSQIAREVKNNPWCIGVFIDNEKSWGRMGTPEGQYGIVINTLSRASQDSPTKQAFSRILKDKYQTVEALNAAWSTDMKDWDELDGGIVLTDHSAAKQVDYAILLEAYAKKYFQVVHDELEKAMPNHMYMGARFATWGMTPEVIKAASEYSDVMSFNEYREIPHPEQWSFLDDLDRPKIIGEFHIGTQGDTGLFHPGLVLATDQKDRARMYKDYMHSVIDNPNFVGAHWFQYIDSPLTGRAYDGENYNVGFVSVADVPYDDMVEAAQSLNQELYARRYGDAANNE